MTTAYQALGALTELIQPGEPAFAYDEFATVTRLLSDGTSPSNFVLQSSATDVRRAAYTWVAMEAADVEVLRSYAETKAPQSFVQEDGTARTVVVLDFRAEREAPGTETYRSSVTLLEWDPPIQSLAPAPVNIVVAVPAPTIP